MHKILKHAEIGYLSVTIGLYAAFTFIWYGFYQRRLEASDNMFNPSVIEKTPESTYKMGLVVFGVALLILILILLGLRKNMMVAKVFFVIAFLVQSAVVVLIGFMLKEIEGVYFWKSPYVEKYFYLLGLVSLLSIWVLLKWLVHLFKKTSKSA